MSEPAKVITEFEAAFRDGYGLGYEQGASDASKFECGGGNTHKLTQNKNEDSAWETSETKSKHDPAKVTFAPGQRVHYVSHAGATPENGIVKCLHPHNDKIVFVVYACDGNWDKYQNYTGCSTTVTELKEGWV